MINLHELRAIHLGLQHFRHSLRGLTLMVFIDNTAAFSTVLNQEAQLLLRWVESWELTLVPQFIMRARNVVADSLSCRHLMLGSEWTVAQEVVNNLQAMWPVKVDLFVTSLNYRLPVYFSPLNDPMAAGTDAFSRCGVVFRHMPSHLSCLFDRS